MRQILRQVAAIGRALGRRPRQLIRLRLQLCLDGGDLLPAPRTTASSHPVRAATGIRRHRASWRRGKVPCRPRRRASACRHAARGTRRGCARRHPRQAPSAPARRARRRPCGNQPDRGRPSRAGPATARSSVPAQHAEDRDQYVGACRDRHTHPKTWRLDLDRRVARRDDVRDHLREAGRRGSSLGRRIASPSMQQAGRECVPARDDAQRRARFTQLREDRRLARDTPAPSCPAARAPVSHASVLRHRNRRHPAVGKGGNIG